MKRFILLFLCVAFFSCRNDIKPKVNTNGNYNVSDTIYIDIKGNEYKFLGIIPDSLRTDEQTRLIVALNDITINHIIVNEENHLVLNLSKEEYLSKGLPERYYKILQQNIIDNNNFIDENGIENVYEMMEERKEEYHRVRPKLKE